MEFYEYPAKPWEEILKGAPSKGRHLASKLVRYESSQRLSAEEVCKKKALLPITDKLTVATITSRPLTIHISWHDGVLRTPPTGGDSPCQPRFAKAIKLHGTA